MLKGKKRSIVIYLSGALFLFFAGKQSIVYLSRGTEKTASYIMYPVLIAQNKIVEPIKKWFEKKRTMQELEQYVVALQAERDELLADNIQLHATLDYLKDIKELIDFKKQYVEKNDYVVQILVKHFSEQSHFFLIDGGSYKGIKKNMVAVYKNCLIGRVTEVYPFYSKVVLITDKACKVASYCKQTKSNGIHHGTNNVSSTTINHVSHLSAVKKGDHVISSGEGLIFPRGFALGTIISYKAEDLFYTIEIEPLIDMRSISHCLIMQKGDTARA